MFGSGGRYLECLASLKRFDLGKDFTPKRRTGSVLALYTRERQGLSWRDVIGAVYKYVEEFSCHQETLSRYVNGEDFFFRKIPLSPCTRESGKTFRDSR